MPKMSSIQGMKSLLSLLLIVNLLACPIRCGSCEANAAAGENCPSVAADCCKNCCGKSESPASEGPRPCQSDDCDCQDCICKGAVLQASVELPAVLVSWCTWLQHDARVDHQADALLLTSVDSSRTLRSSFFTGRATRIGLQSLLI